MLEAAPYDAKGGTVPERGANATKEVIKCAGQACAPVTDNSNPSSVNCSNSCDVAWAMELVVAGCSTMRDELRWELPPSATQGDGPDLALGAFRKLFFGIARLASIANRLGTNVHDRQQIDDALDVLSEDWPGVLAFVEDLCQDGRTPPSQMSFLFSRLAELSTSFGQVRQNHSLNTLLDVMPPANTGGHMESLQCNDSKMRPPTCSTPVGVTSRAWRVGEKPACRTPELSPPGSSRNREIQITPKGIVPPSSPHPSEQKPHVPSSCISMPREPQPDFKPVWKLPAEETNGMTTPSMSTLQEPDSVKELLSALTLTGVHWPEKLPVASATVSTGSTVSLKAALDDDTVVGRNTLDSPATNVLTSAATAIPVALHCSAPAEADLTSARKLHHPQPQCKGLVGQRICALEAKLQAVGGAKLSEQQQQQKQQQTPSVSIGARQASGTRRDRRTAPKRRSVSHNMRSNAARNA